MGQVGPDDLGFGVLFDRIADACLVGGVAEGEVVLANASACRLFGCSADDLVGRPLADLMPERYRAAHTQGLTRYRHGDRLTRGGRPLEVRALTTEGRELPIELTLSPLEHPRSGAHYVLAILRDLRPRQEVADKQAWLSFAAHELKTPLTSLRGFCQLALRQLARDDVVNPARLRRTLEQIDINSARLGEVIDELLRREG